MATHQQFTQDWWDHERVRYRLYSSLAVRAEMSKGDASAASRRLAVIVGIPELPLLPEIEPLADSLCQLLCLPAKATLDATHLAYAIAHRFDYLLTWNCTHLANASLQKTLFEYCLYHHLHMPVFCTPELLKPLP